MNFPRGHEPETAQPGTDGLPSETVVVAVARAADVDPVELPSLHDVVDPDALDALFRNRLPGSVRFEYYGYSVTVRDDGRVAVHE